MGIANLTMFVFLIGVAFSPFAGTCNRSSLAEGATDNPLLKSDSIQMALKFQDAMRQIYKEVSPAVVLIATTAEVNNPMFNDPMFRRFFQIPEGQRRGQKQSGLGTGFIISNDGYVVTNTHVVQIAQGAKIDKIIVKLTNGKEYQASIVGSDARSDLALLKISGVKNLKTVHLGDSDKVEVGDYAFAIGNPHGLQSTFTTGVISAINRDLNHDGLPKIQTDASINPGNSGGPLINIRGEVIGINQMIYSQTGGSIGLGFAIPVNHAKQVIEKLKSGKKIRYGYVGLQVDGEPTDEKLNALGVKGKLGLIVNQVALNSPAFKAGLQAYDFITHVDGKPAENFSVLKATVTQKGPGETVELKIIRQGQEKTVKVKIGEAPLQDAQQ
ncbi:MAG: putative serine protease HtrA [Turneriella sp.]|nr:putative serine protease HtrA [Turneriella sp.]